MNIIIGWFGRLDMRYDIKKNKKQNGAYNVYPIQKPGKNNFIGKTINEPEI